MINITVLQLDLIEVILTRMSYTFLMIRWLIALSMSAGCINIPDEQTSIPDDAGIDAGAPDCAPETSTGLVSDVLGNSTIYTAATADLNGDGCADLIVTHVGGQPGIFVKYGPLDKTGDMLRYDEHIITTTQPVALAVANVVGDARLDIVVFGQTGTTPNTGSGQIQIFENGESSPHFSQSITELASFVPASSNTIGDQPIHILIGGFGGTGGQNIVVGDLSQLAMFDSNNLGAGSSTVPVDGAMYSSINKLLPYSDGFLVTERDKIRYYSPTQGTVTTLTAVPAISITSAELFDIDSAGGPDVIAAGGTFVGGFLNQLTEPSDLTEITPTDIPTTTDIYQLSIVPGQPGDAPLAVLFEQTPATIQSYALDSSTGRVNSANGSTNSIPVGFTPIVAVVLNVDNSAPSEYWLLSTNGRFLCFVRSENTLMRCPAIGS